jgi:hypothetical protein
MDSNPSYRGGKNIAMKVPPHQWQPTVHFYRDVAALPVVSDSAESVAFAFGTNTLHIDLCKHLSQTEVWLELVSNDIDGAKVHLERAGVTRCDEIEALPDGFNGFWVSSPALIVHLVSDSE